MAAKKQIRITITNPYLNGIDLLIQDGLYETQAEIFKDALRRLFKHYEIRALGEACVEKPPVA